MTTVDPWATLRALRAHPLVEAVARDDDEDVNGADAVDALADLCAILDKALAAAPRSAGKGRRASRPGRPAR